MFASGPATATSESFPAPKSSSILAHLSLIDHKTYFYERTCYVIIVLFVEQIDLAQTLINPRAIQAFAVNRGAVIVVRFSLSDCIREQLDVGKSLMNPRTIKAFAMSEPLVILIVPLKVRDVGILTMDRYADKRTRSKILNKRIRW